MEVDAEGSSQINSLKRCNSEPSINVSEASPSSSFSTSSDVSSSGTNQIVGHMLERGRRFSTSVVGLSMPLAKVPSRLDQIKLEECVGQSDREAAHEKEMQSAMLMSQSWDELSLDDGDAMVTDLKRPKSITEPLHVLTSSMYPYASSPSPTRVGKQCFSPSLQQTVRNCTFTPSPGSSPTRQTCIRRSLSPIVLRPSPLSAVKRKAEADSTDKAQDYFSPAKKCRMSSSPGGDSSSPERHHRHHLLSSSSSGISCGTTEDTAASSDEQIPSNYELASNHPFKGFHPNAILSSVFSARLVDSSFNSDETDSQGVVLPDASESSETNDASMTDITTSTTT